MTNLTHLKACKIGIFCLALIGVTPILAQDIDDLFREDMPKTWQEIEAVLPPFPESQNLVPFTVGAFHDKKFMIDGANINVGKDWVLRFTLVIESKEGAQTISYEGLRCETTERRVYAFGHAADKRWSKPKKSDWARVPPGANVYAELAGTYFCPIGGRTVFTPEDAIRALNSH